MLKNELQEIEELLFHPDISGSRIINEININSQVSSIRKAWENAAFSGMQEHSLVRYFHYHLEGISKLSDTLSYLKDEDLENIQCRLLSLIDRLKLYYTPYFNLSGNAPLAYYRRLISLLAGRLESIRENLQVANVNSALRTCLTNWLTEMNKTGYHVQFSFCSLVYLEYFVGQLSCLDLQVEELENKLVNLLSRSNFNHLSFFVYRQNAVRDCLASLPSTEQQLDYLQQQRAAVLSCPEIKNLVYDGNWPSLKTMMSEWLHEEIRLVELNIHKEREARLGCTIQKLPLDLSVSQLACFIRLFFEENKFAVENLKVIFSFFARSYSTKRQPVISPGSLSKEFYSINQKTAAHVREILQKMVTRINRNFFPVVVAAGIAIHVYPGMR